MLTLKVRLIAVCFLLLTCNVAFSQSATPAPQTIVENMVKRYAAFSSYEDSGVVETVTNDPLAKRQTELGFKTYYTRPNKLRFEWFTYSLISSPNKNLVWSDGAKAFKSYAFDDGNIETKEDLGMAVAGATGISRGSAHTVPGLLDSELGGFSLAELTKLTLKGQEVFEGDDCYVVEGYHPNGESWQMWISKKDSLLRKFKMPSTEGQFTEEIHRNIRVDARIAEAIYQPKVVSGRLVEEVSKEKQAEIRRLLELILPRERINQDLSDLVDIVKKIVPQAPEKTVIEVITDLRLDSEMVQQIYVPIYDWHYTTEDIKQLIELYESPLGQKMRRTEDLIDIQAVQRGIGIGEELMKRIQERLRAKGYKVTAALSRPQ